MKRTSVWVVIHCEIVQPADAPVVDELVFHVSSSRKMAEKYVASWHGIAVYSWWKIQRHFIDEGLDEDRFGPFSCFTHKGKPIASPPIKRAIALFERAKRRGDLLGL